MDFLKKFIPTAANRDLHLGDEQHAVGVWKLHTKASCKGQPVSVLVFSESPAMLPLARNYLKRLKTVKHPNVLAFIHDDDHAEGKTLKIIVERVQPVPWEQIGKNAAWREWFLLTAQNGFEFCTREAQLIHANIPNAFLMAADGSARIAGFEVAAPREESAELVDLAERSCNWFRAAGDQASFKSLFSKFGPPNKQARLEQISSELLTLPVRSPTDRDIFYRRLRDELSAFPDVFVQNRLVPTLLPYFKTGPMSLDLAKVLLGTKSPAALEALIESPERAVRMMLLDNMEFISGSIGEKPISQLLGSFHDSLPPLRDATLKAALTLFPQMTDKQKQETVRGFLKLCGDEQPSIRTNALICLSKTPSASIKDGKELTKTLSVGMRDSYPAARKMAMTVVRTHAALFTPEDVFIVLIPAVSPLVLDKADMDVPLLAAALLKGFVNKEGNSVEAPINKPIILQQKSPTTGSPPSSISTATKSSEPSPIVTPIVKPSKLEEDREVEEKEEAPLITGGVRKMRLGASRTLN